ncbi:MAG: GPR endopeptidase [Clostridia bacterium]
MIRNYRELLEFGQSGEKIDSDQITKKILDKNLILYHKIDDDNIDYYSFLLETSIVDDKDLFICLENNVVKVLNKMMSKYKITKKSFILVVGIGNENITADSLGEKVCKKIIPTKHLYDNKIIKSGYGILASFVPSVAGVSGLDSSNIIKAIVKSQKPDLVIVVDTIAARDYNKLNRCVQITDDGIVAGGGVGNDKEKLDKEHLSVPVIAVGVPLVAYISRIISSVTNSNINLPDKLASWVVSTKEIDFEVLAFGSVLANCINRSVHK